ncbi:MAG: ribosome-binding factor A [Rickettsiales bacterium]|jgi:ribosome-binding factor A|nr:ribosome-binding factor A [Rickettsiales bacterium]
MVNMKINYQRETKTNFQLQRGSKLQKVLNEVFCDSSFLLNGKNVFVNVVYADFSKDLLDAKVVVDTFGLDENQKQELVRRLNRDFVRQIRGIITQKMKIKYTPNITFYCPEENKKEKKVLDLIREEEERENAAK